MHGFGFASALGELGLKGSGDLRGLVGFNVGVEIGQLIFVAVFLPALAVLKRGRGAVLDAADRVARGGNRWRLLVG